MTNSPVFETILAQKYSYEIDKFKTIGKSGSNKGFKYWIQNKFRKTGLEMSSPIALVIGTIGTGKTEIAKILFEYAIEKQKKGIWLDWQDERQKYPESFVGNGQAAEQLLNIIYAGFRDRFPKSYFKQFEDVSQLVRASENKVLAEVEASQSWVEPIAALAKLSGVAASSLRSLIANSPVGPVYALIPDELKDAASEAVSVSVKSAVESIAKSVLNKKEYQAYVSGTEMLCNALAVDLRHATSRLPSVIVLDHSELVATFFPWLRHVIKQTGNNLVWIITTSSQPNLVDQFRNDVILAEKLVDFSVTSLSIKEIEDVVRFSFPQSRNPTPGEIRTLYSATLGNLAALNVALQIWSPNSKTDIGVLLHSDSHHSNIVSAVFQTYLQSLNADKPTQLALLTTSFLHSNETGLLEYVLSGLEAVTKVDSLATRYPFLYDSQNRLTPSAGYWFREQFFKVHDDQTLDLIKARALDWWCAKLNTFDNSGNLTEQLRLPNWTHTLLGVIYHSFWLNSNTAEVGLMRALTSLLLLPEKEIAAYLLVARQLLGPLYQANGRQRYLFNIFQWGILAVIFDDDINGDISPSTSQDEVLAIKNKRMRDITFWGSEHRNEAFVECEKAVHSNGLLVLALKTYRAKFLALEGRYEDSYATLMSSFSDKSNQDKAENRLLGQAFTNLANAIFYRGASPSLTVRCFEMSIKLAGGSAWLYQLLSEAHYRNYDFEKTLEFADKAIALDPEYTAAYCSKARAQHQLRFWDDSLKTYSEALQLAKNPKLRALILTNVALILIAIDKSVEADKKIDAALQEDPSYAFAHILKIQLERVKNPERTLIQLEQAIEYLDSVQDAHVDIILSLLANHSDDVAIGILERILAEVKKVQFFNYRVLATVRFELGNRYYSKSRWKDALMQYQEATIVYPRFQPAQYQIAKVFLKLGRQQEAAEQLFRLWQSDLDFSARLAEGELIQLSTLSFRQLESGKRKRSGSQRGSMTNLLEQAGVEILQRRWDKARSFALMANRAYPDEWLSYLYLATIEIETNNYDSAARYAIDLTVLLKESYRGIAYYMLGQIYVHQQKYEKATDYYLLALKDYLLTTLPSQSARSQISLELGFCYLYLEDEERATKHFRDAYYLDPSETSGKLGNIILQMQAGAVTEAQLNLLRMARSSQWKQRLNRVKDNAKNPSIAQFYEEFVNEVVVYPLLLGALIVGDRELFNDITLVTGNKQLSNIDLSHPLIKNSPVDWDRLLELKSNETTNSA